MLVNSIQILSCLLFPAASIVLAKRFRVAEWLGPVVLCYLFGMLLANINAIPGLSGATMNQKVAEPMIFLGVAFSIPLLLYATDFIRWLRLAKTTLISFVIMLLAVLIASSAVFFLLGSQIKDAHKVSGMLVGLYTGGTPNMSAIGLSVGVDKARFALVNGIDLMLGGAYLLCLLTFAQKVALRFLPPFKAPDAADSDNEEAPSEADLALAGGEGKGISTKETMQGTLKGLGLTLVVVAISAGLAIAVYGKLDDTSLPLVFLSLSTLSILASFSPKIRSLPGTFQAGEYTLLIFCVAIGTLTDLQKLAAAANPSLLLYIASVMFGALLLHFIAMAVLKIDADTAIITSTAGVYGAPFIVPVANALKNKHVIVSGLMTSLVGYALGTYMGIGLSYVLKSLGG